VDHGEIDPSEIRVDTTVVETNIRFPTDSSLLWDGFRTLLRLFGKARAYAPGLIPHRFHERKVKKDHLVITRYAASPDRKRQRKVQRAKFRLIQQVVRIAQVAMEFVETVEHTPDAVLEVIASEIHNYLPLIAQVLDVTQRAWIGGETVPASERIFSLFEPHTELIKRGRRHKPVEFGHMICLGQSRERFITQYDVMEKKIPDCFLPERIVEEHTADFGTPPKMMAGDRGFCGKPEAMKALREKVKGVAIPQRLKDFADDAFVALQHFRAGIEGTISVLKRVFGLLRCPLRGFTSFAAHVGLGVLCHNLVILATSPP
jgi:IS5 family transposase